MSPHDGVEVDGLSRSTSLKRKRDSDFAPSRSSPSVKLTNGHSTADGSSNEEYRSPSSLTSVSSVFSSNMNAFAQNRKPSLANGLTPLTNDTDSSPLKGTSPQNLNSSADMVPTNGVLAASHMPASDITPEPSISRPERPRMLPPPGKAKGYRVVWDPELDSKLSKEERKRATPRKKEFGTEVRHIFHNSLSLHNIIDIT